MIEDVDILYVADESARTLEKILASGATIVKSFTLDPTIDLVGVTIKLPESAVIPIARLDQVVVLAYGSPDLILEEE